MRRLIAIVLSLGMLGILAAPAAASQHGLLQNIPVQTETFDGTISITEITRDGSVLNIAGTIEGLLNGEAITDTFTSTLDLGSGGQGSSCQILFLTLGPLELDLLGLVIEIPDPIILDVRAERGPGNLLGNLLCAVAGLLDGGPFAAIDNLLNRINNLLG